MHSLLNISISNYNYINIVVIESIKTLLVSLQIMKLILEVSKKT